jgi:hypothetical protein
MPGASSPTQLGPSTRSRAGRAAVQQARWRKRRAGRVIQPRREKPAAITTAARVPRAASSPPPHLDGRASAGVQMTASSGVCRQARDIGNAPVRPNSVAAMPG